MAEELLPCPFCGGKPEFRRSGQQGHYIACTGCDASSAMFTAAKDDVRDLVIETWNRRTPPPSTHVAVEDVARRIYEDAHKGMSNIWAWNDRGLDDEHPGTRERYLGYALSAIAALTTTEGSTE